MANEKKKDNKKFFTEPKMEVHSSSSHSPYKISDNTIATTLLKKTTYTNKLQKKELSISFYSFLKNVFVLRAI